MLRFVCRAHMATWFIAALRGANLRYSNWIFCIQQLSYWDSPKDTKLTSVRRRLICQLHAPSLTFDCFETRYELSRRRWVSIRRGGFMTDVHEVSICLKSFFFRSIDTHLEAFSVFNQNFLRLIVETSSFSLRRKTPQEEVTFWTQDIPEISRSVWLFKESGFWQRSHELRNKSLVHCYRSQSNINSWPLLVQKASRAVNSIVPKKNIKSIIKKRVFVDDDDSQIFTRTINSLLRRKVHLTCFSMCA